MSVSGRCECQLPFYKLQVSLDLYPCLCPESESENWARKAIHSRGKRTSLLFLSGALSPLGPRGQVCLWLQRHQWPRLWPSPCPPTPPLCSEHPLSVPLPPAWLRSTSVRGVTPTLAPRSPPAVLRGRQEVKAFTQSQQLIIAGAGIGAPSQARPWAHLTWSLLGLLVKCGDCWPPALTLQATLPSSLFSP